MITNKNYPIILLDLNYTLVGNSNDINISSPIKIRSKLKNIGNGLLNY